MGPELALIGTIASTAFSVFGKIQEGQAAADAANYQAQVNRNNQILADQNARYAADAGAAQAQSQDFETRAVLGTIEAAQGASGFDVDSPTSRDVRRGAAQLGRLDAQTLMANAMLTSRGYSAQAANFGAQAELDKLKASNARTAGWTGALGSLLGGASSFSSKWNSFKTVGVT